MSDHLYRILSPSPTSFKRTPTVSRLREHDRKNASLDWLVGLCAGSGAKTRIERMQEKRIFKILSAAPSPEPGTCGGGESSISSMLLSYAEEDPSVDRVCRPESPDPEWADEVGGNITGIRDAKPSVLKPWKEPNFGITFRYRLKNNEVFDDPKESQLPGNRSLYGGQWFERECQPRMLYLPSPPSPVCSGCSDTSDGPLEMRRDRACKEWVFSGGYRRIRKGKDDVVDETCLEGLRIPSEPAKITDHTLPSFALTGEHIHCFPNIAWPQRPRAGLNLERACAQYKEIGRLHEIYEEQRNMYVRTYNESTRVGPAAPSAPSSIGPQTSNTNKADIESSPLPKWVIRRQQVQAEYAENPQGNHRSSANYCSSSQLYTASQMIDEQAKKVQKQIATEREREIITEQKKLAAQRQQAQHRFKAFKPDPKKSIIAQRAPKSKVGGRVVFTRPREMARPRGLIVKNRVVLAAGRKAEVKEDCNSSAESIRKVLDAMGECKVKAEERATIAAGEVKKNTKKAASTMTELSTKAKEIEEIAVAIDKLKANTEKVDEDVTTTIGELKNTIEIVRPSTGEAGAEKATDSCKKVLKDVSRTTRQGVEKGAIHTAIKNCNKLNSRIGEKKYGNDCASELHPPKPIKSQLLTAFAVDSDSEEEWDPKWIVERPRRYSMEHRNSHLH